MKTLRKLTPMRLLVAICVWWTLGPVVLRAATWVIGDVFVAVGGGCYNVYSNSGVFKQEICDGLGGFTTGCEFDPALDKLYTTNFSNSKVIVYADADPHTKLQTIDVAANGGASPESIAFGTSGGFFVGIADGNHNPQKFNAAGTFLQKYAVATQDRGSDWIDLATDQTTLFYTSEGPTVFKFSTVGVGTQLTNFTTIPGVFNCFANRLLPPGDGSAGLLVACNTSVKLLNGSGTVVHTYTPPGAGGGLFGLNLDPNGTSFWTSDDVTGKVYRINIGTGAVEVGPITVSGQVFGVCVKGERTAGAGFGPGPTCGHHTVHGHLVTTPPPHLAVSGIHHGQHGHLVTPGAECPPHAPFHSPGLTAETSGEGLFSSNAAAQEPTFVAGLNQDGTLNGNAAAGTKVLPARRGTVVQLFGSAAGLFLDEQDLRAASGFTPPASGSPLFYTTSLPEVRIGGAAVQVLFSGLAPGLSGVWQINVLIPNDAPVGSALVTINYEGDELASVSLTIE